MHEADCRQLAMILHAFKAVELEADAAVLSVISRATEIVEEVQDVHSLCLLIKSFEKLQIEDHRNTELMNNASYTNYSATDELVVSSLRRVNSLLHRDVSVNSDVRSSHKSRSPSNTISLASTASLAQSLPLLKERLLVRGSDSGDLSRLFFSLTRLIAVHSAEHVMTGTVGELGALCLALGTNSIRNVSTTSSKKNSYESSTGVDDNISIKLCESVQCFFNKVASDVIQQRYIDRSNRDIPMGLLSSYLAGLAAFKENIAHFHGIDTPKVPYSIRERIPAALGRALVIQRFSERAPLASLIRSVETLHMERECKDFLEEANGRLGNPSESFPKVTS